MSAYLGHCKPRSTLMETMYAALARERMRAAEGDAERLRVVHDLAAARRWRRIAAGAEAVRIRARREQGRHLARLA
jgi:hypothetical protein